MKKRITQAGLVKRQITRAVMEGRHLATFAAVALLLVSASLALDQGEAFAAGEAATRAYPQLSGRNNALSQVWYLDGPASVVNLPNGLTDVALRDPYKDNNGVWILPMFFGGKLRGAFYDSSNFTFVLRSGAHIQLVNYPANGSWKKADGTDIYIRSDGARFGYEDFELPDGIEDLGLQCGDIRSGVVRLDAAGKPLWRKTYVAIQRNPPEAEWGRNCSHYSHQAQVTGQGDLVGFGDDTIGVLVGTTVIRVSADTGMPIGPTPDVNVFDSEKVAKARAAMYSKLFGSNMRPGIDSEADYYKWEAGYFFPHGK
jgi:hypothetical protein